jgi:hypothetical protein
MRYAEFNLQQETKTMVQITTAAPLEAHTNHVTVQIADPHNGSEMMVQSLIVASRDPRVFVHMNRASNYR